MTGQVETHPTPLYQEAEGVWTLETTADMKTSGGQSSGVGVPTEGNDDYVSKPPLESEETKSDDLGKEDISKGADGGGADTKSSSVKKSGVSFSTVSVRTHRLTLGVNPGVSIGLPLELAWHAEDSETFDLEAFEQLYNNSNEERSSGTSAGSARGSVRRLPRAVREDIARQNHSRDSLIKRKQEVIQIKKSRKKSEADRGSLLASIREAREAKNTKENNKTGRGVLGWFKRK